MHEIAIVQALIEQVQREVREAGATGPVVCLELVVGRLSGANPDSLRFAFGMLAPGTVVEQARLEIAEPKAVCACRVCGARTPIEELIVECPACGSAQIAIVEGRQLLLQAIEVKDEG